MNAARWVARAVFLIWELPQNVLGGTLLALHGARRTVKSVRFERERVMVELETIGAVSLGLFVFYTHRDNKYVPVGRENADHEYGHSVQSRLLGPLYLPIIGITSEMRVAYAFGHRTLSGHRWAGYYDGFPENWADRLGRVDRTLRPPP